MKGYRRADGVITHLTESGVWAAVVDDGTGVEGKEIGSFPSDEEAREALLQARIHPSRILRIRVKA